MYREANMKTKQLLAGIITCATILCLIGCDNSSSTDVNLDTFDLEDELSSLPTTYSGEGIEKIGISMPAVELERWVHDGNLLKECFENAGYEAEVLFGNNLIDTQINDINTLIDDGADLLIISPVDSDSLVYCMKRAHEEGIPVISYDRLILHSPYILAYVSYDNYEVGRMQAQYIIDTLDLENAAEGDSYSIEIFSGDPADNNAKYFYQGAMDTLSEYLDSGVLTVPSEQTDFYSCSVSSWSTSMAEERMDILLSGYYSDNKTLDAVLVANDSLALGVANAITDSYTGENQIIITGQDCDTANIANIESGLQSMSIYKNLQNEVYLTCYIVESYINGASSNSDLSDGNDFDFTITYDTNSYQVDGYAVPSYLLAPQLITSDNISDLPDYD